MDNIEDRLAAALMKTTNLVFVAVALEASPDQMQSLLRKVDNIAMKALREYDRHRGVN